MSNDHSPWLIFILLGLATILPRASFIVLGGRVTLPSIVQRALRYAPAAALAAIVAPDVVITGGVFDPLNDKLAGAVVAVISVMSSRNPWLPFIAGMGVLLALRNGPRW